MQSISKTTVSQTTAQQIVRAALACACQKCSIRQRWGVTPNRPASAVNQLGARSPNLLDRCEGVRLQEQQATVI
jgi:hypothetical protein